LSDADMAELIDYLTVMTPAKAPGVDGAVLHFATIVTPDSDPERRRGMLDVLAHYVAEQNASALAGSPGTHASRGAMGRPDRRWRLLVWQLTGPASTWDEQLRTWLAREPVLAAISGVGGQTWAPIHRFCEQAALPCLLPNVDIPVVADQDFYSVYFSRGVLLEADLIARELAQGRDSPKPRRIVQIFREDDIGKPAAKSLSSAATGIEFLNRPLERGSIKPRLAALLSGLDEHDALVLWLRPKDLAALAGLPVPKAKVFISGLMGGLESAPVAAAWRRVAVMAYPFDLPDRRVIRTDYPLGWFRNKQIAVDDERLQTDTWLACRLLSLTLNYMDDVYLRDYLVERFEGMLEHQIVTGYYPRLTLASNQRFASKGGYLVKFADPGGTRLTAVSDWVVP
jgi:hypothetical protein